MTNKSRKFNTKHVIFIFCLLVCMALSISSVCANDVDVINDTAISQDTVNDGEIAPDVDVDEISSTDDDDISLPDNGEVFSAAGSTVYFDASASSDGSGTKSSPYKYLYGSRLEYVKTAYFADGVYQLKTPLNVYYSSYGTTIIGQSAKNTIIQSTTTSTYDFSISKNANLKLNTITFEGFHIKNEANLEANGVIFKNNGNFLQYSKAGLNNVNHTYTYGYGGIIICDPPENAYTYLTLNNCQFISNSAPYGGVLATYKSQVKINNCYFYNCSSSKFGGAIYSMYSNFTILDTVFRMNNAKYGGIIYSDHDTIFMKNSEISNSNAYSFGGAIATNVSSIDINKCNFTDYSSTTDAGGAIYAVKGKLYVSDSIFKNGLADFGGAICTLKTEFITASSQFWNNYARYYGGTIYNMYGTVYIHSNDFYNSHAEFTGGTIFNGLSNEFKLINNLFLNSTSMYGHTVYVDGDKENIEESGNYYAGLYSLVGIYRTTLNGKDFSLLSNILTFSVSNYGKYITPASNSNSQTNSNVNLKIYKDGSSSSVINTPFDSSNKVMFDLTKYVSGFGDGELDICLIDESGDIIYSGTLAIDAGKSYSKQTFLDLNFKDLMLNMQYGNVYDITFDNAVSLFNYNPVSASSLPSYYNSKDYGYVTPVKNQLEGGNCWAFSGIATLEACIKKATGITYDFSEENAKNLMAAYSLFGVILESNDGGNRDMFSAYLTSWFGPIYDEDDVYDDYSSLSVIFDSIFHVQNIYFIPDRKDTSDNNLIKKAIMDYGAVSISAPWDKGGHAVSLIGWDDEYCGYDHFNDKCSGAWIFKNSWGSSYDSGRYIYISYQHRIYNAYTFIFNNDVAYDDIYQYDYAGVSNYYYYNKDAVYYKNNFVSRGDGILSAFSTYFSESTDYVASIYLNDKLVLTQSGRSFGGYNTILLTKEIQLSKGDKFTVQIKNCNKGVNKIPFCSFYRSNKISSDNGISFLSYDGKTWQDQYDSNRVACIKAFTRSKTLTEITISVNKFDAVKVNTEVNIIVNLPEYYWNGGFQSKLDGLVTFSINGQNYYAQAQNGHANLKVKFDKKGTHVFTAQYKTNKEISNLVKFNFDVVDTIQSKIEILAGDVSKYYGAYKLYSATITNNSNPLSGVSVKIAANGNTYTRTTDSEGKVSLNLDLPVGDYVVTTQYEGKSFSSKYHVLTTIAESDAKGPYLNSIVTASFLNTYGRALSNGEVVFKVGNTEFKTTTDAYGFARQKINLGVGNYTVIVINKATGEQKQCSLEISKADTDCLLTISQNGNVVTANVEITPNSAQGYVYISVGDEFFTANLVNGKASVSVKNMKAGENNATAVYSGDENFKVSLDYKKFTVAERPNHLVVSDGFSYYGSNSTFRAIVYDSDNNTVSGEKVKITVLNKTYTVTSDSHGDAILYLNLPAGDYNFVVEYKGQYYSGTNTVFSTIAASDSITGEYLSTKITATFKNNQGWLLNNKGVTFKVDGKQYKATTNDRGVATADIDLTPGTYVVTAINPVSGQEKEIKVKITKAYPTITLSINQNNKDVVINASLSHSSATGNIIFNVGLSKYTVAVKNGKASLEFKNLAEGKYSVYANYAGDANFFNGLSDTKTFTVSNDNIVIYVPDFEKYYGGSEQLMVKVTNNGAPVKNAFVTVNHTDFYLPRYGITDENGIAYIDINYVYPGEYNITSTAKGCTFVSKLTIKSTIDAEDMICEYGNTYVKATFRNSDGSLLTNEQVSFNYYTDRVNATTNSKGVATALFENYGASENYRSFSAKNPVTGETKKINVLTIKSTPTVTLTCAQDGNKISLTASLSDSRATGKIVFIRAGFKDTRTVSNGKSEKNFNHNTIGTYTYVANYTGDYNFNDALSNSISYTIKDDNYVLSASDLTMYYGGSNKLSVKLTNNGNPVNGATVKFNGIGSVTNYLTNSDGMFYVGFDKNAPGTYTVKAVFGKKSVTSKVTIKSTIVASDLTYEYSSAVAKATFYNTDGSLLSKKQVTITLGGVDNKVTTDSKGVATLDMSNYAPRTYTINVKNPVNGETKSFKVTVTKATPKLIITETHNSDGTERLDVVVSSKKATGKIYVKVDNDDEVYGTIKDGAGVYHDFSNYPSDNYNVVVRYGGDSNFNSVSESLVFTVAKKIDITADNVYMSYGANKYLVIKLTDLNGKPLKNKVVYIYKDFDTDDDFQFYSLKTYSNGKVKLNCNEFGVGVHTIEVEVAKADFFSFNVVVYKATPKLTAAKKTFKVGVKNKKYTVTLKNNLNKAMKHVKVTLKIKGKTFTAKTNSNGKATFNIKNLNKRGTFTASLRYAGNSNYKSVSKSAKITVR